MRGASKALITAVAVLLFAVGLAACGGGGDSTSTATEAARAQSGAGASSQNGTTSGGEANPGSTGSEAKSGGAGGEAPGNASGGSSGNFVPKHHHDSGGGSQQFQVKGGDNSVQEFGAEAGASERDAAATVLHDFLDARAAGDWVAACGYLSKSTVESFEKLAAQAKQVGDTSCGGILEKLTNPAAKQAMRAEAEKANVGSLRIEGERAFVIYTGIDGTVLAMPMTKEGGAWKVASLAGTPLS